MTALLSSAGPRRLGTVAGVLVLALAYYAAARLGLLLAFPGTNASPVWPPSGIALAAVAIFGLRVVPGVALGALAANALVFAANEAAGWPALIGASIAIAAGNTLEALVTTLALRRWIGERRPFDRLIDVAKFILIALLGCTTSAAIGTFSLLGSGIAPVAAAPTIVLTWWTGDVTGMLVVAPLLMTTLPRLMAPRVQRSPDGWLPALALGALIVLLGSAIFIHPPFAQGADRRFVWAFLPCIAWAAFRHGSPGVSGASLLICALAVWGTTRGLGPFASGHLNDALIVLQTFVALCAVTGLVLAADRRERLRLARDRTLRRDIAVPWAVLLGCLGIAIVGWQVVASDTERRAHDRFSYLVDVMRTRIDERMLGYEQLLRGGAALFAASQTVERDEFRAFVGGLHAERRYPGMLAMGFLQRVPASAREVHVRARRAEGFADYDIRPPGERDEYVPVVFIEPFDDVNRRAFGFDGWSEPNRRNAMVEARDSGNPTLSGKVALRQSNDDATRPGVLLFLPIYRNATALQTREQRREATIGYVTGVFRVEQLMAGLLGTDLGGVRLRLYDGATTAPEALLYDSHTGAAPHPSPFTTTQDLTVPNRRWTLQVDALPAFDADIDREKAQIVLIAGVGISLLLFALVRSLSLTGERAQLLAQDMTTALRASEAAAQHELALRIQADAELAAKNDALVRSNTELAQFAYVASHDLQEPLRTVTSYSQLLLRRYRPRLDGEAVEFLDFIGDAARRAQALIHDLLSLARLDSNAAAHAPVAMEQVLADTRRALELALKENDAVLTHDPLPTVNGDRSQLQQLLQNLIGNAIKFHGSEPPRIHVGVAPEDGVAGSPPMWRFSVRDNGIGIDPRFHDRIFTLFQRLHRADYPGTGIGLAICKKVVERHGGRIGVESTPHAGSTFCFTIPAQVAPAAPAAGDTPRDPA